LANPLQVVVSALLQDYCLPWDGAHGVSHWARVLENGLRLAPETGADVAVVSLFAVLHDSRRHNEGRDPDHGPRAAVFAAGLRGTAFELDADQFLLLAQACEGHTHERTHSDITVQTCWDSDRLDLGRVGIEPHPSRLCTEVAKRPEILRWANRRSGAQTVPAFVLEEWKIDLAQHDSWG